MATAKKAPKKKAASKSAAPGKRNYKSEYEHYQKSRRQMAAILMFTIGVLLLAIAIIPGTNLWTWLHNAFYGLFGITALVIPAVLIYLAIMAALDKPIGEIHHKIWQAGILVLLICALMEICSKTAFEGSGFFSVLGTLFSKGSKLQGGGFFSSVIGWPLMAACGKTGAIIIISLFLFAFIMLLTGATLLGFFRGVAKPVKKIEETYTARRAEYEQKQANKFAIDVDLGPDSAEEIPEPMPQHPVSSPKPSLKDLLEWEKQQSKDDAKAQLRILKEKTSTFGKDIENHLSDSDTSVPRIAVEELDEEILSSDFSVPENLPPIQKTLAEQKVIEVRDEMVSDPIQELVDRALNYEKTDKEKGTPSAEPQESAGEALPAEPVESVFDLTDQSRLYTDQNNQMMEYIHPPVSLLKASVQNNAQDVSGELHANADLLVNTLKSFGVQTKVIDISRGPTVTRYELQPSVGVKISKITGLADDIALNLAATGVRIEAPIPGKPAVGIEVPNKTTDIVTMREIIDSPEFSEASSKLSMALGRDIAGNCVVADIAKMPHMLIAGSTGSGKSVCINSIIVSLLYKSSPSEVRLLMVDPKVVELGIYNGIPHLLVPVVTDPRKAAGALGWAVTEMLNRYKLFADNNVRDLKGYNELAKESEELDPMPQIVIIIDELADLMMAAPNEVEDSICRLAQMARAAGMHLIIATQRPSVDVITGIIKANIPSRIAFAVSSQVDSRTILDSGGAEKLLGRGDMLFYPVGMPKPLRVQGCFVSDKEVEKVVSFIKNKETAVYDDKVLEEIEKQAVQEKGASNDGGGFDDSDELLSDAIECVLEAGQASTSYLQRKLKVGYARAARLVDEMEAKGIISGYEGSKPRQVLITRQQWIEMSLNQPE